MYYFYPWWFNPFPIVEYQRDKVSCRSSYLSPGTYECSYYVRAVTSGVFVVPPAKAQVAMQPEVMGLSEYDFLKVNPRTQQRRH